MGDVGGEHLDRLDAAIERIRHVAQRAREMADLVAARSEIGDFQAVVHAAAHAFGSGGKPADRLGDGAGEKDGQKHGDQNGYGEGEEHDLAFAAQDLVDLATLRRKDKGAKHSAETLDRNGDGNDDFVLVVDADDRNGRTVQGGVHFGELTAVLQAIFRLAGIIVAKQPIVKSSPKAERKIIITRAQGRQFGLNDVAARVEAAAVDHQQAVAVINAAADIGRRYDTAKDRPCPLRIYGKVHADEIIVGTGSAGTGLHETVGIDDDRVGIDRCRGGKRRRHDLALGQKALHARVDQALAKLIEIENAGNQNDQAGDVQQHDAAGQAGGRKAGKPAGTALLGGLSRIGVGSRIILLHPFGHLDICHHWTSHPAGGVAPYPLRLP